MQDILAIPELKTKEFNSDTIMPWDTYTTLEVNLVENLRALHSFVLFNGFIEQSRRHPNKKKTNLYKLIVHSIVTEQSLDLRTKSLYVSFLQLILKIHRQNPGLTNKTDHQEGVIWIITSCSQ